VVIAAPAIGLLAWVMPAHASVTPTAQICGAFSTWDHHKTLANANAMLTDVMRDPWVKYVSEDMTGVYADYRGGTASAKYLAKDIKYAVSDC
jgi:hypothetical protein